MLRRIGDEPDPPHVDFSGLGYGDMDMLNIDIKFPSEHTLCGRTFDGEMQYFFYHPGHEKLVAITWLLVAQENATNNHMQLLIDEFQAVYDGNEDICVQNNTLQNETDGRPTGYGRLFRNRRRPWDPFHADIQKT
jgi:carbonic anhydrase